MQTELILSTYQFKKFETYRTLMSDMQDYLLLEECADENYVDKPSELGQPALQIKGDFLDDG